MSGPGQLGWGCLTARGFESSAGWKGTLRRNLQHLSSQGISNPTINVAMHPLCCGPLPTSALGPSITMAVPRQRSGESTPPTAGGLSFGFQVHSGSEGERGARTRTRAAAARFSNLRSRAREREAEEADAVRVSAGVSPSAPLRTCCVAATRRLTPRTKRWRPLSSMLWNMLPWSTIR